MISGQRAGAVIVILGVITGIIGATINDFGMHLPAIQVWTLADQSPPVHLGSWQHERMVELNPLVQGLGGAVCRV